LHGLKAIMGIQKTQFMINTQDNNHIYKSATFINFCSVFHHA